MRKLLFILLISISGSVFSQDFPARSSRLVNDFSNTLSAEDIQALESKLVAYDRESSVQIAIVIIRALDGYEISDYAFGLGEAWGVGRSGKDNGALILVSIEDRKMWIATGYGLEATLTDAMCKRIIENEMKPNFRNGDFAGGLAAASDAIIQVTKGEYQGEAGNGDMEDQPGPIGFVVLVLLVFGIVWGVKAMQVKRYARINHLGFWAAWALLNTLNRSHSGSYRSFTGGSGGFSRGGFGGGGGGGFGGFGGGSFGGGGAGGSW
jgi:uncharacterized protein